jgi:hypothetical protein
MPPTVTTGSDVSLSVSPSALFSTEDRLGGCYPDSLSLSWLYQLLSRSPDTISAFEKRYFLDFFCEECGHRYPLRQILRSAERLSELLKRSSSSCPTSSAQDSVRSHSQLLSFCQKKIPSSHYLLFDSKSSLCLLLIQHQRFHLPSSILPHPPQVPRSCGSEHLPPVLSVPHLPTLLSAPPPPALPDRQVALPSWGGPQSWRVFEEIPLADASPLRPLPPTHRSDAEWSPVGDLGVGCLLSLCDASNQD